MLKLNSIFKSGLLTTLTVVTGILIFQPAASAWKITRTGRELPVNEFLTIGSKTFSCGGSYGFIPGAILENNGQTSTVFMDEPLCLPYSPLGSTSGNTFTTSFSFNNTSQGVQVNLHFYSPERPEFPAGEITDNWTLEGYIEQVSLGNGSYRKNIFTGEGTEQTTRTFPTPYHEGSFNSGSVGLPIGSDPYYSTNSSIVSSNSTSGPTAEDYRQLWLASGEFNLNSGGIFRRADYGYLMQPEWGPYWPSGNVVADYYKLTSYDLQPGRDDKGNDKDMIPNVFKERVVESSLLPNFSENTIYVDEQSKTSWLAKLATPNEVKTLEKLTSALKGYDPNQIIKDIEFKPQLSNNERTISFDFAPKTDDGIPIQLGTLAKALGYEYFNYLQMISGVPKSETWWDESGKRVAHKGKITTSKGTGAFFDLLPGGNIILAYNESDLNARARHIINSTQLSPQDLNYVKNDFDWVKADTQPFYNDVPGYGGKQPGNWGTYEDHADLYKVSMEDTPFSGTNPNNEHRLFHTLLVGVKDKGKTFHPLEGLGKYWSSNTTCSKGMPLDSENICIGGISGGPSELLPEFTTGGIEILDDSVTFDELPDDVIDLIVASGGKLIKADGTEYIRNQNPKGVPEPSSILGLITLCIGAAIKRKCG